MTARLIHMHGNRADLLTSWAHDNTEVGKLYIRNCREALKWAGEQVGYAIEASHGSVNV